MAKKTDSEAQGCLGTQCNDSTCLACQVAQSARQHAETLAALNRVVEAIPRLTAPSASTGGQTGGQMAPVADQPPAKVADQPPAKELTIDGLRPLVLEWIKANGRDKFVAVLQKFGAAKLPDIKPIDLPRLAAELGIKV